MPSHQKDIETICAFVSGEMPASIFEQHLYSNVSIEELLSQEAAPCYAHTGTTLFNYLIALHYDDPGDLLTVQGALADFLTKRGVKFTHSNAPTELYDLILSAQPRWLDADTKYISDLLASAPELPTSERKAWLRRRILELFQYVKRPPKWIQSPNWPMGKNGPMVFFGQIAINEYFHDHAAAYVFHDPATGECKSIIQVA